MQKGDVIYRQQAIDAVKSYWKNEVDRIPKKSTDFDVFTQICDSILSHNANICKVIDKLPSAQPERQPPTEDDYAYCAECNSVEMCRWYPLYGCQFRSLPSAQPEKTCCGYDEKELIAFAIACRRNEVDEKDLKTFAQDCEFAWRVMQEEFDSMIREAFEKWTGGKSDAD